MRHIINGENGRVGYISGGLFESNGKWTHPKCILDDYELILCKRGNFRMYVNDRVFEIQEGDGLFLFPGEVHYGIGETESVSFYWMHFLFEKKATVLERSSDVGGVISEVLAGNTFDGYLLSEVFRAEQMERLIILSKQLLDYEKSIVHTRRMCDLQMELILIEVTGICLRQRIHRFNQKNPNSVLSSVCDYIRANLYTNIRVWQLANRFGYNSEYFVRMFQQQMGITPKQYIINTQMERARFLLTTTDMKIYEIAEKIGFSDEKQFMKSFKAHEGMSATKYRRTFGQTHYNSQ